MPNWTIIDEAAVRTGKLTVYVDTMQAQAAAKSESDPLPEMIADVVSRIRGAISAGNQLDQDAAKIPNSLKGLAKSMITFLVKDYLQSLEDSDQKQATRDDARLREITANKTVFETPDTPAGDAEMQGGGSIEQTTGAATEGKAPQVATRKTLDGL